MHKVITALSLLTSGVLQLKFDFISLCTLQRPVHAYLCEKAFIGSKMSMWSGKLSVFTNRLKMVQYRLLCKYADIFKPRLSYAFWQFLYIQILLIYHVSGYYWWKNIKTYKGWGGTMFIPNFIKIFLIFKILLEYDTKRRTDIRTRWYCKPVFRHKIMNTGNYFFRRPDVVISRWQWAEERPEKFLVI
jgi:hypothetical protein